MHAAYRARSLQRQKTAASGTATPAVNVDEDSTTDEEPSAVLKCGRGTPHGVSSQKHPQSGGRAPGTRGPALPRKNGRPPAGKAPPPVSSAAATEPEVMISDDDDDDCVALPEAANPPCDAKACAQHDPHMCFPRAPTPNTATSG